MSLRVMMALLVSVPAISASTAWVDFITHSAEPASPEGSVPATNLASERRAAPTFTDPNAFSAAVTIQPGKPGGDYIRQVTVNSFIAGGETAEDKVKARIFSLCQGGAAGTNFAKLPGATPLAQNPNDEMPPQCMYCLARGYGTTERTPGFYLPCGCQQTCVDVSGNLNANFARTGLPQQDGSSTSLTAIKLFPTDTSNYQPLKTCSDYVANRLVYPCQDLATYHFVLWPSVLAGLALIYTAYSMINMQLDMDSLLYTVGSSSKKEN